MARKLGLLRFLLVDDDQSLVSDVKRLGWPEIEFTCIAAGEAAALKDARLSFDAIVIGADTPRAQNLLAIFCGRPLAPPVIALAGRVAPGVPLEHVLTLAELRGAALALPKPIAPDELALAVLDVLTRKAGKSTLARDLVKELERRAS